jgi:hypothetical protein
MFGKKENTVEDQARNARAAAELDRLMALPPEALAVEVLPAMRAAIEENGDDGAGQIINLQAELMSAFYPYDLDTRAMSHAIDEAVQRLEHANLVVRSNSDADFWRITRLGQQVLAAGDVAARLARITG